MLMFSERTWKHHCVTLVVPFAVICYYLAMYSPGKGLRAYLIGSLAASMLLNPRPGSRALTSWSSQVLPSGSLNVANEL